MNPDLAFRITKQGAEATARLLARIGASYDRQHYSIEVPEWGDDGQPLRIWWRPLTLSDKARSFPSLLKNADEDPTAQFLSLAFLVAVKAEDETGAKLFDSDEGRRQLIERADSAIVTKIASAILGSQQITPPALDTGELR
jgi:hypothetical protein